MGQWAQSWAHALPTRRGRTYCSAFPQPIETHHLVICPIGAGHVGNLRHFPLAPSTRIVPSISRQNSGDWRLKRGDLLILHSTAVSLSLPLHSSGKVEGSPDLLSFGEILTPIHGGSRWRAPPRPGAGILRRWDLVRLYLPRSSSGDPVSCLKLLPFWVLMI